MREGTPISRKVFVGNLSYQTTEDQLREAFSTAGQVVSARIINDRETGRSRGFGFVEFGSEQDAEQAVRSMNDADLGGRKLRVNVAEERAPRAGGPGGGPRGGDRGRGGFNSGPRPGGGGGGFGDGGGFSEGFGGGGFGKPFNKPKGSRRGIRGRKRSLG